MLIEAPVKTETVIYPDSDGEPMAETGIHVLLIAYLISILRAFFRHRPDVYVSGNIFLYYEEGNPKKRVAPDVFVVFGVPNAHVERRSWFLWKEGKAPAVVFEFTSEATSGEDTEFKRELYERIGVGEYILYDPLDEYLRPNLQGERRVGGKFKPIPAERGELVSQLLGLVFRAAGEELQLFDRATGTRLLPQPELAEAYLQMQTRLEEEAAARRRAEDRAEQAVIRVGEAESRAEQEAQARQAAEAELARLRAELARLKGEAT